jgi:hypothetical protein
MDVKADGGNTCAILTTCLVGTCLAVSIPLDQEGQQLWREASALLSQFRSELSRPKPTTPQHRPPHGTQLDPLRRLATLLSSQPHLTRVLSHGREAAGGGCGSSDLSWLCSDFTRKLMFCVVNTIWPQWSSNAVSTDKCSWLGAGLCSLSLLMQSQIRRF